VRRAAALLAAALLAGAAAADHADWLATEGKLSGEDFYRVVACRAQPGGPCTLEPVRWPPEKARDLRVALRDPPEGYPQGTARRMSVALDHAIAEINGAGAALRLRRAASAAAADITVHLPRVPEGGRIAGTGIEGVDGERIEAALVTVWWDEDMALTGAAIVMAETMPAADILPVMLEELTQAMGLMTDIRNPLYDSLSVFSEDSNAVTRLGPQDREALRRHYPGGSP
jgi:hypothetical protein